SDGAAGAADERGMAISPLANTKIPSRGRAARTLFVMCTLLDPHLSQIAKHGQGPRPRACCGSMRRVRSGGSAIDHPVVELRGAAKRYDDFEALKPTTMSLQPGVSVLLGPTGCGKST